MLKNHPIGRPPFSLFHFSKGKSVTYVFGQFFLPELNLFLNFSLSQQSVASKTVTHVSSQNCYLCLKTVFPRSFSSCLIFFLFPNFIYLIFLVVKFWDTFPKISRPKQNHIPSNPNPDPLHTHHQPHYNYTPQPYLTTSTNQRMRGGGQVWAVVKSLCFQGVGGMEKILT